MGKIVLLDDLTINKIAAGEVIERPASVVKEMVENSIDAGAKNIGVEIKNGGIAYIKITDDGCGIAEDDMEIAFERHATSKIRSAGDLATVTTMGFRGEALASIAAIANVEMISKKSGEEIGHRLVIEGGKILERCEVGCPVGTTIIVRNLFYNTPVRYKFLKKDFSEAGFIEDTLKRIALVNKSIAIKLINSGKTVVSTNGSGDFKNIIYSIYGKDIANGIMEVNSELDGIKVTGVVGKPEIARANRQNQIFFVNGRYIKDKNLTAAVDQGYKGLVPIGKYGFVILNIELSPDRLDVNVHPAKLEVRFQDENAVFKAVYYAIKSGLASGELVANIENPINIDKLPEKAIEEKKVFGANTDETKKLEINSEMSIDERIKAINSIIKEISLETNKKPESSIKVEDDSKNKFKFKFGEKDDNDFVENNFIEEIYNKRNNIVNPAVEENLGNKFISNDVKDEEKKEADYTDEDFLDKTIQYGNTRISSNTAGISIAEINEKLKENNSVNFATFEQKKEDITGEDEKINDGNETDLPKVEENAEIIEEENNVNNLFKNDEIINAIENKLNNDENEEIKINEKEENEEEKDVTVNEEIQDEKKEEFYSAITDKILEGKLNGQDTESIDTNKIKEAIKNVPNEITPEFEKMYKQAFGIDLEENRRNEALNKSNEKLENMEFENASNQSLFDNSIDFRELEYKFIGIAFSTYIIIEIKDNMYMIDQHAAHERIMYEKVKANYYKDDERESQLLLIPDIITLTNKEIDIANENKEMFYKAGFEFEEFGENTLKLTSVPSMCEDMNTKTLFIELLDEIDTVALTATQEKEDKFIATVACKAAVKGNMKLDIKEVESLMEQLLSLPNPFSCPHGRPTAIKMTKYDIERKFSRK